MKFSNWINWSNRNSMEGIKFPGIYCIAVVESDISNGSFQLIPEIKYIGMTNSKGGLKGRLNQFDNTLKDKLQHGGADRFWYKYREPYEELVQKMFVSVWFFECKVDSKKHEDLLKMGEVAKSEYFCFAEYDKNMMNFQNSINKILQNIQKTINDLIAYMLCIQINNFATPVKSLKM